MKALVYLLAGMLLVSFDSREPAAVDGIWTGVYRSDNSREKVLIRFEEAQQLELYQGEVTDSNKFTGRYELSGDTLLKVTYQNSQGKSIVMQGSINKRKNYVDGVWETSDNKKGSFYLKKEKLQELFIQP